MSVVPAKAPRDPRLDFFRGIAFLIIYVAHIPGNAWARYIPARYGYSDAADMFVLMSGMAAALAFGSTFVNRSFFVGCARVAQRVWQVYWAHLGLFFVIAGLSVAANILISPYTDVDYIIKLNLARFFEDTPRALLDLFTLSYVPNYFDILPMYLVLLAMIPLMMLLSRVHPLVPVAFSLLLWAAHQQYDFFLQADRTYQPAPGREWFFNPFGWQLVFFAGFAVMRGWIRLPMDRRLFAVALTFTVLCTVVVLRSVNQSVIVADDIRGFLALGWYKNDYGITRLLHVGAMGYVAVYLLQGREHWLPKVAPFFIKCGQQSLPVFLLGMVLSRVAGAVLDLLGRDATSWAVVNLGGIVILIAYAYMIGWIKSQPWRKTPKTVERTRSTIAGGAPVPAE